MVTRLSLRLDEKGGWGDTSLELPEGRWADLLAPGRAYPGGSRLPLTGLLADRPVALLERTAG